MSSADAKQILLNVPQEEHTAFKMRCVETNVPMKRVIRACMQMYVNGALVIPEDIRTKCGIGGPFRLPVDIHTPPA